MKRILTTIASLLIISITWTHLLAQQADLLSGKVHIKVKKNVNGVETFIDTVISVSDFTELDGMLKELGVDVSAPHNPQEEAQREITIDSENDQTPKVELRIDVEKSSDAMGENLENVLGDEKIKVILDDLDVDVETLKDGKDIQHIRVIAYSFSIRDLDPADKNALEEAGVDPQSIESGLPQAQLSFFPNPTEGIFRLTYTSESNADLGLRIRDISGKEIYRNNIPGTSGMFEAEINISEQAPGIYFLTLIQEGKALTKKLVID